MNRPCGPDMTILQTREEGQPRAMWLKAVPQVSPLRRALGAGASAIPR